MKKITGEIPVTVSLRAVGEEWRPCLQVDVDKSGLMTIRDLESFSSFAAAQAWATSYIAFRKLWRG